MYSSIVPQLDFAIDQFFISYPETKSQLQYLLSNLDEQYIFSLALQGIKIGFSDEHTNLRSLIEQIYFEVQQNGDLTLRSKNLLRDPMGLVDNPLYLFLHESLYCESGPSSWGAESVFIDKLERPSKSRIDNFFFSENIFHEYFRYEELSSFLDLMEGIMAFDQWPKQFNIEELRKSETQVTGIIYNNDAYVSREFSIESSSTLNNCKAIFSDLDHHGMRNNSEEIFSLLLGEMDE
ncbi:MAG: hypothetical protein U0R17_00775 [Acidimicrobiia bacterium]